MNLGNKNQLHRDKFSRLIDLLDDKTKKSYVFAENTTYTLNGVTHPTNKFFHETTFSNVEEMLKTDYNLYEVCFSKIRKLYFDFDGIDYTHEEANDFINAFIEKLNSVLEIKIEINDIVVLKNENKTKSGEHTNNIHSLHIIIPKFKMDYRQQRKLVKYLNSKYELYIDENVYSENQQFRSYNQSKLKYGVKLVNFYEGDVTIKKTLINITNDRCKSLKFTKEHNTIETLDGDVTPFQIKKEDIFSYVMGTTIFGEAIFNQHAFFNSISDWKTATMILIKNPQLYPIEKWKTESVRIANNTKFTIERNEDYCSNIKAEKVKSGLPTLYNIVSKYSTHKVYSTELSIKPHTITNLKKHYTDEVIKDITEMIINPQKITIIDGSGKKRQTTKDLYEFNTISNETSIINVKTGFISFGTNQEAINIYCDNQPRRTESMFNDVNNINEAKTKTTEFIRGDKKIFILKSRWGTGKTSNIITYLLEQYKEYKILLITESTTLNNKLRKDFEEDNFVSHIETQKDKSIKLSQHDHVICSIQSISKVANETYDIVIIDEFESVLTSYLATRTFKSANTTPQEAFNILINIMKRSEKTLLTDADISEDKVTLIADTFGRENMMIVKNNQLAFQDFKFTIMTNKQNCVTQMINVLCNENKRVAVASATATLINAIIKINVYNKTNDDEVSEVNSEDNSDDFEVTGINKEKLKNKKILVVTQVGVCVYHKGEKTTHDKDETLKDVEKFIIDKNIDLFMYSPTIKTGVSINSDYFHTTFGFGSKYSVLFNEFIQMIFRNRKLKDNHIVLYLQEEEFNNYSHNQDEEQTIRQLNANDKFYKSLIKDNVLYTRHECSKHYYELQTINNKNARNSRYNYITNLFELIQYHQLKYVFITKDTYAQQEQSITQQDQYNLNIEITLLKFKLQVRDDWIATKLFPYKRYVQLTIMEDDKRNELLNNTDEKSRYDKTKVMYLLFKIKELVEHETNKMLEASPYRTINELTRQEQNQLQLLIDEIIKRSNNTIFYDTFITQQKKDYVINIIYRLFTSTEYIQNTLTSDDEMGWNRVTIERLGNMFNLFNGFDDIKLKKYLSNPVYNSKKIFTPQKITNRKFKLLIIEQLEFFTDLYEKKLLEKKKQVGVFDVKNKKHVKSIYHIVKELLGYANINMKYENKNNTSRDYDMFVITNDDGFYKYNRFNKSDTLDHLTDHSTPAPITLNKEDVFSENETLKLLKRKIISKTEKIKLQKSLMYYDTDSVDCERIINGKCYNPLLSMKTINDDVVIDDKTHPVKQNKYKDYFIETGKKSRTKTTIYRYIKPAIYEGSNGNYTKTKANIIYYKPYEADIPTLNTTPNENEGDDVEQKTTNDDDREENRNMWANWELENKDTCYCYENKTLIELGLNIASLKDNEMINKLNINTLLMKEIIQRSIKEQI